MADFKNLTLSDFYSMPIVTRTNGTITPLIGHDNKGRPVGLAGFNGNHSDTDMQVREKAFLYYKDLLERLEEAEAKNKYPIQ